MAASPDGRYLVGLASDGRARRYPVFDLAPQRLVERRELGRDGRVLARPPAVAPHVHHVGEFRPVHS